MPVPRSVAFAVVTVLFVGAGCVQTPPGPLPQATPSWSCTPVAGGTPYACYEHDYQQTSAQNKLYEEAEAVFRKFNAEDERIYRAGGADKATPVIEETLSGSFLASVVANHADLKREHTRLVDGHFAIASVERLSEIQQGSVAALKVCSDVSSVTMRSGNDKPFRLGQDLVNTVYFVRAESSLKIDSGSFEWVKSC